MTHYIKEEILCEAYTKLNIDIFNDKKKLSELQNYLITFFGQRARFYFGEDVQIKVEFEEGSLITKLKVIGGAAAIMATIVGDYGSFRSGVSQISQDAGFLAQMANLEVTYKTRTAYCDRIDSERRKGIFGRVDDLIRKLDAVHEKISNSKLPSNAATLKEFNSNIDALLAWNETSEKFFNKLRDAPTKACFSAGLLEELERLPDNVSWESELKGKSFRAMLANRNPNLAGSIAGAVARYNTSLYEVKESMRRKVDIYAPKNI